MVGSVRGKEEEHYNIQVVMKYWQITHEYRIRIPKLVKEAYAFDKYNKLWTEGINE